MRKHSHVTGTPCLLLLAVAFAVLGTVLLLPLTAHAATTALPDLAARGKYIFGAAGGCGCHTELNSKAVNSGGRKYEGPFGTVYSTNITPDRETGIGSWTDEQIITAIRLGRRPNGDRLIPVHPYTVFNGMAEEDLQALVAYLRSVPPVKRANQPKKIVPLFESVALPVWLAAFAPRETPPPTAPTSGVARGEYLVRAVGHCGECHTPRGMTQATDNSRFLAGTQKGPDGTPVQNITPDKDTGLTWSVDEIAWFLGTGNKPDGDVVGGVMGEVIQGTSAGYKDLTEADRVAIARYLKSIPPVKNKIDMSKK
ncbi:MAG TPA: cytochrome c [Candidatus Methylomirabilis sp.]|nr:cytochrome c [Candidatus Methylomirabilis sp.]